MGEEGKGREEKGRGGQGLVYSRRFGPHKTYGRPWRI